MAGGKLVERSEQVRKKITECASNIETQYIELCKLLHEAWENAYFVQWGFENLEDYCKEELGMKYRKARYLISIADAVKRSGVKWEDITDIGWTHMRAIARVLSKDNAAQWLERARSSTADGINETVRQYLNEGVLNENAPKVASIQIRMSESEAIIIMDAIERAKRITESNSFTTALEYICYEWIQQSADGPTKTPIEHVLRWVREIYGVDLQPSGPQDIRSMLSNETGG